MDDVFHLHVGTFVPSSNAVCYMNVQIISLHVTILFLGYWITILISDASNICIESFIFTIVAPRSTFLLLAFHSLFIGVILTSLALAARNSI